MENIYKIWNDTKEERLTQATFCDFSTPKKGTNKKFNVYDDIKWKLVKKGIPENEIAFIHDYETDIQKKELFAKVRSGQVRVVFGSTQKMGVGTNIQDRLVALHDLDCPWRPSDLEQRSGRILRQGNLNPEVELYRYVTKSTFDSYLYQTLELKQKFISQIMTDKNPVRSCEDVDESVLNYAEIKALAAGNPKIKEKMLLDVQVAKLCVAKAGHQQNQYLLQDRLRKELPRTISALEYRIKKLALDVEQNRANAGESIKEFSPMAVAGTTYDKRDEAGKALMEEVRGYYDVNPMQIAEYRGFDILVEFNPHFAVTQLVVKGNEEHRINVGDSESGAITRINNVLNGLEEKLEKAQTELKEAVSQVQMAQAELERPFAGEQELAEKAARLAELNLELNIDNHSRGGAEEEEGLTLGEDEEYDFQNELAEVGLDADTLFRRSSEDIRESMQVPEVAIESVSPENDLDTTVRAPTNNRQETGEIPSAVETVATPFIINPYAEKMDLERYADYGNPKAAQFLDIHGIAVHEATEKDDAAYHLLAEGAVNSLLQANNVVPQSLNPYSANEQYHYVRDCAMSIVCKELDMQDHPYPEDVKGLSETDMRVLKEKGKELAELALYGHLAQAERDRILASQTPSSLSAEPSAQENDAIMANVPATPEAPQISPVERSEDRKAVIASAKQQGLVILTDAMEGRSYSGEIVEMGAAYAIQKVDAARGIIHNLKNIDAELGLGYVEIAYGQDFQASVSTQEEQRQVANMSR